MFCPNCGNNNDDGSRFCINCGNSLENKERTVQEILDGMTDEERLVTAFLIDNAARGKNNTYNCPHCGSEIEGCICRNENAIASIVSRMDELRSIYNSLLSSVELIRRDVNEIKTTIDYLGEK